MSEKDKLTYKVLLDRRHPIQGGAFFLQNMPYLDIKPRKNYKFAYCVR